MYSNHVNFIPIHEGRIHGGITMRQADLPEKGNMALHVCQDPAAVAANRDALASCTLPLARWVLPWQKHTDRIAEITPDLAGRGALEADSSIMDVDAVYTTCPNLLIGVFTADCLGILLADPTVPLVCAVHSGWKGTAQNILYKTLDHLDKKGMLHPETLQVYFSPSIQKNSFEIGPEVRSALLESGDEIGLDYSDLIEDVSESDRSFADHQAMNVRILKSFAIPDASIHTSSLDTKTNETCFSFRRDHKKTGEHFTFGWISDSHNLQ